MKRLTRPIALMLALVLCAGITSLGALASEEEPVLDGDALISSVTIGGSAPRAGDKAEPFDPSVRFASETAGCHVASRGRWSWYCQGEKINNAEYRFTPGQEYRFTMYIAAEDGYRFAAGAAVAFVDARLRGVVTNRSDDELTLDVYAAMDGTFDAAADTVKSVKLTDFTAPREGEYPDRNVTVLFSNTGTATLNWYDAENNNYPVFEPLSSGTYLLVIRVTTMSGFQFDRDVEVYLGDTRCTDVRTHYNDEGFGDEGFDKEYGKYGYLEARFTFTLEARTRIEAVGVHGLEAYAGDSAGAIDTGSLSCGNAAYGFRDGTLQWKTAAGTSFTGVFEEGEQYVLDVRYDLRDAEEYVFGDSVLAYIDGMPFADYDTRILSHSDDSVTVRYTVTARARPSVIDRVNIAIDAPEAGKDPALAVVTGFGTQLYPTDAVEWYENGGRMTGSFAPGGRYKVVIWLMAQDGYEFAENGGDPAVTVTVNGMPAAVRRAYEQSADRVVEVEYDFGVCGEAETRLMGDADGNGAVNAYDAALTLRYSIELPTGAIDYDAADMNHDERIDQIDAALILRVSPGA